MKNIAIIGTGLCALRAGLEIALNKTTHLTFWEKSPSVGGRVATRRLESQFINHGATKFDNLELVMKQDHVARKFEPFFDFSEGATKLPKAMKDEINKLTSNIQWNFNKKITRITLDGKLESEEDLYEYDTILITAPLPQTEILLGQKFAFPYSYSKTILFLGLENGTPIRIEMPADWSDSSFELSDEKIVASAEVILNRNLNGFTVKKWRYARVLKGMDLPYLQYSPNIVLANEAFDPDYRYDCASAWLSGLKAGRTLFIPT
jgi:predicted NAD/FAD-dependent oxidoreductase